MNRLHIVTMCVIVVVTMSYGYVSCDPNNQMPIVSIGGSIRSIPCIGDDEEIGNLAYFLARKCARDAGVVVGNVMSIGYRLELCITPKPFVCPGVSSLGKVAECGGPWVIVSKTYVGNYSYIHHIGLGVLNALIYSGEIRLIKDEGELRKTQQYHDIIDCINENI